MTNNQNKKKQRFQSIKRGEHCVVCSESTPAAEAVRQSSRRTALLLHKQSYIHPAYIHDRMLFFSFFFSSSAFQFFNAGLEKTESKTPGTTNKITLMIKSIQCAQAKVCKHSPHTRRHFKTSVAYQYGY